jgi:ornithine--oxo-acid transaminase
LLATCGNCSCANGCENKPEVKPDILILGKAISGGVYPVSAVLANDAIMNVISQGNTVQHLREPLAAVAIGPSEVRDEQLSVNAERLGIILRKG